jgi:S-adenosylmethionine hydrolase
MIALFTDFGLAGPYTGQMKAVLMRQAPGVPIVDLFADLPAGDPKSAAYLLAAYDRWFAPPIVFLAVVDPGVGSSRRGVVVEADGRFYVGPENGLFELVLRRTKNCRGWEIIWRPEMLSASFHGRDLFAPIAARLAVDGPDPAMLRETEIRRMDDWPDDLSGARLAVSGRVLNRGTTFSEVPPGGAFWYENANGLAEIAVNAGRADDVLGLTVGAPVALC